MVPVKNPWDYGWTIWKYVFFFDGIYFFIELALFYPVHKTFIALRNLFNEYERTEHVILNQNIDLFYSFSFFLSETNPLQTHF